MTLTDQLAAEVLQLGVRPSGVLLVHGALRALTQSGKLITGGAEAIMDGLLQALGPEGTLLMPALSYETVTDDQPHFDLLKTPSCVGLLSETFRQRPGVLRSLHPTHSVCGIGPQAEAMLGDQGQDRTPCGNHSPFCQLQDVGGQILMLGCGLKPNTSMHAIEEWIEPEYLYGKTQTYRLTDGSGNTFTADYRTHGFIGWQQRYDRVANLLPPSALREQRVLEGQAFLIEAKALWVRALRKLQGNPLYFVDPSNPS